MDATTMIPVVCAMRRATMTSKNKKQKNNNYYFFNVDSFLQNGFKVFNTTDLIPKNNNTICLLLLTYLSMRHSPS